MFELLEVRFSFSAFVSLEVPEPRVTEEVESVMLEVDSFADVEEAYLPCKISSFEICPCGVSEATFKEEALFSEVEAEAPFVELLFSAFVSLLPVLDVVS